MEEALLERLKTDASVLALSGGRLHWWEVPQNTVSPYCRLSLISEPRDYHLKGGDRLIMALVQIDVFARYGTDATGLRRAIISALSGARWGMISGVFVLTVRDFGATETPDKIFHQSIDLRVIYKGA